MSYIRYLCMYGTLPFANVSVRRSVWAIRWKQHGTREDNDNDDVHDVGHVRSRRVPLRFPYSLHNNRHHESATRSLVHPQAGHAPAWRVSQGTTKKTFQLIQGFPKGGLASFANPPTCFFFGSIIFIFFVVDSSQSYKRSPRAQRLAIVFGRFGRYFLGVFSDWIWQS